MRRPRAKTAAATLVVCVGVFVVWPSPVDPVVIDATPAVPFEGPWGPNEALDAAEHIPADGLPGPEDVAIGPDGEVLAGTRDGRIVRVEDDGRVVTVVATGGRPLGLDFAPDGTLIVADADLGLLAVRDGAFEILTNEADGVPFKFTDDVDVARDGRIYFSDASSKFGTPDYIYDLFEGRPHGRLLRHDRTTGETEVLLDGLYFANGIALASDESFVLVNETYRYRVTRYWLTGPAAGTHDVFIDGLPGFPDGISADPDGGFWLAFFTVRNAAAQMLAPRPWARALVAKLPRFMWPKAQRYGLVAQLDESGVVLRTLQDPDGEHVPQVTSAERVGEWLYLGTLDGDRVSRWPVTP